MTLQSGISEGVESFGLLKTQVLKGRKFSVWFAFFFLVLGLCLICPRYAFAAELTLVVKGELRPGTLYVAVYAAEHVRDTKTKRDWNSDTIKLDKFQLLSAEPVSLVIADLDYRALALRAYIDVNQNAELDVNSVGYPREPVAYSRAPGRNKPSKKFENAVFLFDPDNLAVEMEFVGGKQGNKKVEK